MHRDHGLAAYLEASIDDQYNKPVHHIRGVAGQQGSEGMLVFEDLPF